MLNRRSFLQTTAVAIGVNDRGFSLLKSLLAMITDNMEVVALCDVDATVLARRAAEIEILSGGRSRKSAGLNADCAYRKPDSVPAGA